MPYPQNLPFVAAVGTLLGHGTDVVGVAAAALNGGTAAYGKVFLLQARSTNAGTITIGGAATITSVGGGATLAASDTLVIAIDNLASIFAIASAPAQNLDWLQLS